MPSDERASALIFDCDGTLADTMPAHYRAWVDLLRPFGVVFDEARFYALGGVPTVEISRMLVTENGLAVDHLELARRKEQAFVAKVGEVRPIEKVVAVARAARGRRPMAVASGGPRRVVDLTLRQIGVRDWFLAVVAAEDTERHKPHPDVFLEASRRLGVAPAACTVYEDTDLGLEAARRAGMRAVDVRTL
jgi:HAD superfamily hydrolase (TIGR01509 family)